MRPLDVYEMPKCDCCGVLMTWNPLTREESGRKFRLCSPSCDQVFTSYLLPTYGWHSLQAGTRD